MKYLKILGMTGFVLATGCGQVAEQESVDLGQTGRAGALELVPAVRVDGLEALTARTAGSLFVEEVIMNARGVHLWDTQGDPQDIKGAARFFLRYNPGAGERGLSRLYAPADGRYSQLTVDIAPLFLSEETLEEESRTRGLDLAPLNNASVVIRGMLAVNAADERNMEGEVRQAGLTCTAGRQGLMCEGTVPDTAPARGPLAERALTSTQNQGVLESNGTVPDTAPARDEALTAEHGIEKRLPLDGSTPQRRYRPFVLVAQSSFVLGTELSPALLLGNSHVVLHLDVNQLFSDARLAELASAVGLQSEALVVRVVRDDEISASFHVESSEVVGLGAPPPPSPASN
jgi:hypothetical protein